MQSAGLGLAGGQICGRSEGWQAFISSEENVGDYLWQEQGADASVKAGRFWAQLGKREGSVWTQWEVF